jgi:hypothetical protein
MRGTAVGRLLDGVAAALFALFLIAAVPKTLQRATNLLRFTRHTAHETSLEGRIRFGGEDYVRAIDEIRAALAPSQPYLLVEGGRPQDGGAYWVRYDLAPRRAVFLGPLDELTDARRLRRRLAANLRQVVVAYGPGRPPRLYERYLFVAEIEAREKAGAPAAVAANPSPDGR